MFTLPAGSFPKKEMERLQARLTRAITKIFSIVAENLLTKKADPYDIEDWQICNNGTMRGKELRILQAAGALPYSNKKMDKSPNYYSWSSSQSSRGYHNYEKLFNDHSKEYMITVAFPEVPLSVTHFLEQAALASGYDTSSRHLKYDGYQEVRNMANSEKIYVYHNIDLYDTNIKESDRYNKNPIISVYPKAMLENRLKSVIKAVMKKYCEEDLLDYLHNKFSDFGVNLNGLSQKLGASPSDMKFKHTLRNTARYPVTFNKECYETAWNSYIKEYKNVVSSINFEFNRIKKFKYAVDSIGGTGALLNDYIKTSIDNLIGKSLTLINGDEDDKDALQFILDHRDLITYDYLYGPTSTHKEIA